MELEEGGNAPTNPRFTPYWLRDASVRMISWGVRNRPIWKSRVIVGDAPPRVLSVHASPRGRCNKRPPIGGIERCCL